MSTVENLYLHDLKKSLKELLSGDPAEPTTAWLISKVPLLMRSIEKGNSVNKLPGSKKKEVLIEVICDYINDEKDAHDEAALYFTKHVLPTLIDTLVSVDISKLRIKTKDCIAQCCLIA